jgi:SAM-dependent methyltransferase
MTDRTHDPSEQIGLGNRWYVEDQFQVQMGHPGSRDVILNRWRIFEEAISQWQKEQSGGKTSPRVLDAGCGDGINILGLGQIAKHLGIAPEIYGVDYNPLRVGRAGDMPGVREVIQARLDDLPYADGFFDVVLCNHVLEHIAEDGPVVRSLRRITAHGGLLIVGVPNEGCLMGRIRNHLLQRSVLRRTDHVHFHTGATISALIRSADFRLVKLERCGFLTPHGAVHYLLTMSRAGRSLLRQLGALFPSQSADLILIARRS